VRATSFLNAIRAFEAAARHESFAKAAAELRVSHTVVSRHVRNLEHWLSTGLFVRSGNRVALTDDARMIAPKITAAFLAIDESFEGLRSAPRKTRIRVTAEPAFATRWLRRHAHAFRAEYPNIEIDLTASRSPPGRESGAADVVIHFEQRLQARNPHARRLFPIDAFPACSAGFLRSHVQVAAAGDIRTLPLVHDHGLDIWREWFTRYEPGCEAWRNGRVYSDLSLAIDAAVDGEGVILADDILCARELETGALVRLDDRIVRCTWYCVAFDDAVVSDPAIAAFASWLDRQVR